MIRGDIMDMPDHELAYALCCFIHEVRKKNRDNHPAETLYDIIICLQLYMAMYGKEIKVLEDEQFIPVRNTLDNRMKELSRSGIIAPRRQAEPITVESENLMWEKGILGDTNPKQLVNTLVYMFGVHSALRAGAEHRALRVGPKSQIVQEFDGQLGLKFLRYTEDFSKNRQGGLDHRKITRKIVRAYENCDDPKRCLVKLYEKYLSSRPVDVRCPIDMYLRPLAKPNGNVWYTMQPIGRYKLSKIVAEMASEIGLSGKVTNHSLRATTATRLYQSNVDEQLIMEHTGHRSNSVRSYKRTSNGQLRDVSNFLYGKPAESNENSDEFPSKKRCTRSCTDENCNVKFSGNGDKDHDGRQIVVNVSVNIPK